MLVGVLSVLLAASSLVLAPEPAGAALYNLRVGLFGDETIGENDVLTATFTADVAGGEVCIVAASSSAQNCDNPAWGSPNMFIGVGSHIEKPIEAPPLKIGTWKLIAVDRDQRTSESTPFTVVPCSGSSCGSLEALVSLAQWKANAAEGLGPMTASCVAFGGASLGHDIYKALDGILKWAKAASELDKRERLEAVGKILKSLKTIASAGRDLRQITMAMVKVTDSAWGPPTIKSTSKVTTLNWYADTSAWHAAKLLANVSCRAATMYADIIADPPDPNFATVAAPEFTQESLAPDSEWAVAMIELDKVAAYAKATRIAIERYQGAQIAGDIAGQRRQLVAAAEFSSKQYDAMGTAGVALRRVSAVATAKGIWNVTVRSQLEQLDAAQKRMSSGTMNATETADLVAALGATDAATLTELLKGNDTYPTVEARWAAYVDQLKTQQANGLPAAERQKLIDFGMTPEDLTAWEEQVRGGSMAVNFNLDSTDAQRFRALGDALLKTREGVSLFSRRIDQAVRVLPPDPVVTPVAPTVKAITTCGQWGSVTPAGTAGVAYTVTPAGVKEGDYTVTASAKAGHTLAPGAQTTFSGNLGKYWECPVARDDTVSVISEATFNVLDNDTLAPKPAPQPEVVVSKQPTHGTVTCQPTGSCTYLATAGYTGQDSFTYSLSGTSATATVTLTVSVVLTQVTPEPPTVTKINRCGSYGSVTPATTKGVTYTVTPAGVREGRYEVTATPEGGYVFASGATTRWEGDLGRHTLCPVAVDDAVDVSGAAAFDVLANDTFTAELEPKVEVVTRPTSGVVRCTAGTCLYTANRDYVGTDSFTYTIGEGTSATVRLKVMANPRPPETSVAATDDIALTKVGEPVVIDVLRNDRAAAPLSLTAVGAAAHGVATIEGTSIRYQPEAGFTGSDLFSYTATDGTTRATATVRIGVGPVLKDPTLDTGLAPGAALNPGTPVTNKVGGSDTSQDAHAALAAAPEVALEVTGPQRLVKIEAAKGWTVTTTGASPQQQVLAVPGNGALMGSSATQSLPKPLPPVSQGSGGDGHVPIVIGNKVFALFHHAGPTQITCIDLTTGQRCPGYPRVLPVSTGNANGGGAVFGSQMWVHVQVPTPGAYSLYCWDAETDATCGMAILERGKGWGGSAPVRVGDVVWVATGSGNLRCFDPRSGLPCVGINQIPTGLTAPGDQLKVVVGDGSLYVSDLARVACFDLARGARCAGWDTAKDLPGMPVPGYNTSGVQDSICVAGGSLRCVSYADPGTVDVRGGHWPYVELTYSFTDTANVGPRTFYGSLSRGGLGCWDWTTKALCAGPSFGSDGWISTSVDGGSLPSAYGAAWDGRCVIGLGDPGLLFSVDTHGRSPCGTSGAAAQTVDLRDQRCDQTTGSAAWGRVVVSDADLGKDRDFVSFTVKVSDAQTNEELLSRDLVGGESTVDLSGIDAKAHPKLSVTTTIVPTRGSKAWADGHAPKVTLSWKADPSPVCVQARVADVCTAVGATIGYAAMINGVAAPAVSGSVATPQGCGPTPSPTVTPSSPSSPSSPLSQSPSPIVTSNAAQPIAQPSSQPTAQVTAQPTAQPSTQPTAQPTAEGTAAQALHAAGLANPPAGSSVSGSKGAGAKGKNSGAHQGKGKAKSKEKGKITHHGPKVPKGSALPNTGAPGLLRWTPWALAAVVVGLALVLVSRRRRTS